MRLDDDLGGQSNIRVVFFDPPPDWQPVVAERRPMRIVWVLEILPKRRNAWTTNDITRFRASRRLLAKRCYGRGPSLARLLEVTDLAPTDFEKATTLPVSPAALTLQTSAFQAATPIVLALAECDEELRAEALELFKQLAGGSLEEEQRFATTALLAEILFPHADGKGLPGLDLAEAEAIAPSVDPEAGSVLARMDEEESFFARRLRELMEAKGLTQAELAAKVGIGQPAVSMMMNRDCRPQRKTVLRFAQALAVPPEELWPAVTR